MKNLLRVISVSTLSVFLLALLFSTNNVSAATYCVNTTGNDLNNGTCSYPWATVNKALRAISPNDVVVIAPGTYNEYVIASNSLQTADDNISFIGFGMPTIRLANATCNRVVDVISNNVSFDGITFDMNGTLDTCEYGIYVRNNKNYLTVKNSIIKNGVGASAAAIRIETSGQLGSNNALIYNNSFINNENINIDLQGGNQNNTNISNNYIGVGKTTLDYGIYGTSSTGADGFNNTFEYNYFNWTGAVGQEGYAILLQRTTTINSSYNTQIRYNQFGEPNNKWEGTPVRIVREKETNIANNQFWINDTTGNTIIWFEGNTSNITFTSNTFCSATNLCSAISDPFTFADASNVIVHNNSIYYDKFGGDGLWIQSSTTAQSNATITNNYIFINDNTLTAHLIGSGSEGSGGIYRDVYTANNIINITCSTANASSHNHFFGTTINGTSINNTIICGTYGLLAKLSANITYENNFVYNASLASQYDKGSNNSIFRNNYVVPRSTSVNVNYADGVNSASFTRNVSFYNNTIVYPIASQNNTGVGLSLGQYQSGTQSYNNIYYLPYRGYNRTFQNFSTYYNYFNWQNTLGLDLNSTFYPTDSVTLNSPANATYYAGFAWNFTPILNAATFANATLYINYSNGTNYATTLNTSSITNNTGNIINTLINTTNNFTWNVCFKDEYYLNTCALNWFSVSTDIASPTVSFLSPANASNFSQYSNITFQINSTDNTGLTNCYYSVNGAANVSYTCNINFSLLGSTFNHGINNITAYSIDNVNRTANAILFIFVDKIAPTILVNSPLNNSLLNSTTITLNTTIADNFTGVDTCLYSLNGASNVSYNCSLAYIVTASINNTLIIYANDTVGNYNSSQVNFSINSTPTIIINTPVNGSTLIGDITLNTTITTPILPIDTCWYSINNTVNTTYNCSSALIGAFVGTNVLTVYANDTGGDLISSTSIFEYLQTVACNYRYSSTSSNLTLTNENKELKYELVEVGVSPTERYIALLVLLVFGLYLIIQTIKSYYNFGKPKIPTIA